MFEVTKQSLLGHIWHAGGEDPFKALRFVFKILIYPTMLRETE